ncbi:MAG TPA: helix-turn-helix transcriptional regulator [Ktedonobacteraceae bacterium]|nr:helix-turn-helix transcriptional regulator [Ktedonobacteraceae bacterium]
MDARYKPNAQLRRHRQLRGFSQSKLGELIGADQNAVSRWERGERETSPYYQEKLCELFKKTAEELGFLDSTTATAEPAREGLTRSLTQEHEGLPQPARAIAQGILAAKIFFLRKEVCYGDPFSATRHLCDYRKQLAHPC